MGVVSDSLRLTWLACRLNPGWVGTILPLMLMVGALPLAQVAVVRQFINAVAGGVEGGQDPIGAVLLLVAVLGAANLLMSCTPLLQAGFREATVYRLSLAVYRRFEGMEPLAFESPAMLDRLARVETALTRSLPAWAESFAWLVQSAAMTLATGLLFGRIHGGLLLLAVLNSLAFLLAEGAAQTDRFHLFVGQSREHRWESYLAGLLTQKNSLRELLLFGACGRVIARWREVAGALWSRTWGLEKRLAGLMLTGRLAQVGLLGGSVWLLLRLYATGQIDEGLLVGTLSALLLFHQALAMLVVSAGAVFGQGAQAVDLLTFLEAEPRRATQPAVTPAQSGMEIKLEAVSFTYPGGRQPALADVNLQIRPGERVAIVGTNGSGKSTLAKLLLGLYPPSSGRILWDGGTAPGRASAVFQLFQRYWLTVRDNLGFGYLPWLDDTARLQAAAQTADFQGADLESRLGKEFGGTDLSGGQWQRLALGRGLLAPSRLLVLDEITSKLDPGAESALLRSLNGALGSRTVLFVAHRLPLARLADRILVMQGGRIVEAGSHEELLAQNGLYAQFYEAQSQWYRDASS